MYYLQKLWETQRWKVWNKIHCIVWWVENWKQMACNSNFVAFVKKIFIWSNSSLASRISSILSIRIGTQQYSLYIVPCLLQTLWRKSNVQLRTFQWDLHIRVFVPHVCIYWRKHYWINWHALQLWMEYDIINNTEHVCKYYDNGNRISKEFNWKNTSLLIKEKRTKVRWFRSTEASTIYGNIRWSEIIQ